MNEINKLTKDVVLSDSEREWLKVFGITEPHQIDNYKLMKKASELGVRLQIPRHRNHYK